jgi:DNA-binding response OmpR family regulator
LKKILVIENDAPTLELLGLFLEDTGFEVMTSEFKVPIEKIIADAPSLILLDYFLNYGHGKEICTEIKANPATKHIPVVLTSASIDLSRLALECGADAYIEKPFDLFTLENMIRELAL